MPRRRTLTLAAIGTVSGLYGGLFGVGGGAIIVPLLVLALGYDERRATGTSMAAILVSAAYGAGLHGLHGNVDVGAALLVGVPAIGGVLGGTWLQQRVSTRAIAFVFAALLVGLAIDLLAK